MSLYNGSSSSANSTRPTGEVFCESIVKGAGMAVGGSVAGAVIAFLLFPVPGAAETGAEIGRRVGGFFGGTGGA